MERNVVCANCKAVMKFDGSEPCFDCGDVHEPSIGDSIACKQCAAVNKFIDRDFNVSMATCLDIFELGPLGLFKAFAFYTNVQDRKIAAQREKAKYN